jgi:hypothetical protein
MVAAAIISVTATITTVRARPPVDAAAGEVCGERRGACKRDDRKRGSDGERDR